MKRIVYSLKLLLSRSLVCLIFYIEFWTLHGFPRETLGGSGGRVWGQGAGYVEWFWPRLVSGILYSACRLDWSRRSAVDREPVYIDFVPGRPPGRQPQGTRRRPGVTGGAQGRRMARGRPAWCPGAPRGQPEAIGGGWGAAGGARGLGAQHG